MLDTTIFSRNGYFIWNTFHFSNSKCYLKAIFMKYSHFLETKQLLVRSHFPLIEVGKLFWLKKMFSFFWRKIYFFISALTTGWAYYSKAQKRISFTKISILYIPLLIIYIHTHDNGPSFREVIAFGLKGKELIQGIQVPYCDSLLLTYTIWYIWVSKEYSFQQVIFFLLHYTQLLQEIKLTVQISTQKTAQSFGQLG